MVGGVTFEEAKEVAMFGAQKEAAFAEANQLK